MIIHWKVISISTAICMLLSSCCQIGKTPTKPTSVLSSTSVDPSYVPPTSQITDTPSPSLNPTMPPIVQPTMTYVPRLSMAEAEEEVLKMLSDNGGCNLPCFWGFIPGETKVQTFISTRYAWGGSSIAFPRDGMWLEISMIDGSRDSKSEIVRRMAISMIINREMENQKRKVYDNPFYAQDFEYYTLPHLLTTYGPPTDVYILLDLGIEGMGLGIDLFLLALDYTDDGWVALLEMPLLWKDETWQVAIGCPTQAFTQLSLWSPNDTEMAKEYGYADGHGLAMSIDESSFMTLEEFYDQFKDPKNTTCLELPLDVYEE